jgi:hypothetical protein
VLLGREPPVGGATGRDSILFGLTPLKGKQQFFPLRMPSLKTAAFLCFASLNPLCFSMTKGWL